MRWFSREQKKQEIDDSPIKIISINSHNINTDTLSVLKFDKTECPLAIAFVSPHLNFEKIMRELTSAMPFAKKVIGVMTAGELSTCNNQLYHSAEGEWDNIVIQCYSEKIFQKVEVRTVPLLCEDIQSGNVKISRKARIEALSKEIGKVSIPFEVNYQDTLAITFFDGLSASENFFMQAMYESGLFPCWGLGGRKIRFQKGSYF